MTLTKIRTASLFVIYFIFTNATYAQLVVAPLNTSGNNGSGVNLTQWVQTNLIGAGISISNVTYTGDNRQMGDFNAINTVLYTDQNMDKGIVMTTGYATDAIGPNTTSGISRIMDGVTTDADLSQLTSGLLYDKCVLEFDFVPEGPTIKFNYIFGSDEYPEFVGSGFNDAFGFFISGPGITGTQNLAVVPGTSTPITINTVNQFNNSAYYVDNGDALFGGPVEPYKSQPQYIQYDGYTVNLTATAQVQCGQTYHFKLAIADVGDPTLDSGVFIQGGSFTSEGSPVNVAIIEDTTISSQATAIRGCPGTDIIFTRSSGIDTALTVNYITSGSAVEGVDYASILNPVTFAIGQDTIIIPFEALTTGSGLDSLSIKVSYINPCDGTISYNTATFYIEDADDLTITASDTTISCSNPTVQLFASVYGTTLTQYTWSGPGIVAGGNTATPTVNQPGTYTVDITTGGNCPGSGTKQVVVTKTGNLSVMIHSTNPEICLGESSDITAIPSGGTAPYTFVWDNGLTGGNAHTVSPTTTTIYEVLVMDVTGCLGDTTITVIVNNLPTVDAGSPQAICVGESVTLTGSGATSYTWDNGVTDGVAFTPIITTTYTVVGKDTSNCSGTDQVLITVLPLPTVSAGENQIICAGTAVTLSGSGASSYSWDNGVENDVAFVPSVTTTYKVSGTDDLGCHNSGMVTITVEICGCIDPLALNYNGNATISDNSCIYQEPTLEWPNIFTPNDDQINDVYEYTKAGIIQLEYWIFNRWGSLMFQADELNKYWDGKVSGSNALDGVYFVKYKAKGINGKEFEGHTFFHLVR